MNSSRLLISNKNFSFLWFGGSLSALGDWFNIVALNIFVYKLYHKGIDITYLVLAQGIPMALLSSFVGSWVDKIGKKRFVMIVSDVMRAILCIILISSRELYQVYLIAFVLSLVTIMFNPASGALYKYIIEEQFLPLAVRINQFTYYIVSVLGPVLAGWVVQDFGYSFCFAINSASFIMSAVFTLLIRIDGDAKVTEDNKEQNKERATKSAWYDGFVYVFGNNRIVRTVVIGTGLIMLGGGATGTLEVMFAQTTLNFGERGYGYFLSSYSVGMLCGSLLLLIMSKRINALLFYAWGIILCGFFAVMTSLSPIPLVSIIFWGIAGIGTSWFNTERRTLLQVYSAKEYIGRVLNTNDSLYWTGYLLSSLLTGLLVSSTNIRLVFGAASSVILLAGLWSILSFRSIPVMK